MPWTHAPQFELVCHPASAAGAVRTLRVSVRREDARLLLRYRLEGELARLALPSPDRPAEPDRLWATTCMEAFVAHPGAAAYDEWNFSTSGQWAHYHFRGYRVRCHEREAPPPCGVAVLVKEDLLELDACLPLPLTDTVGVPLSIGLTAVVEEAGGAHSYWALRHCAAKPDFHLHESFVLRLDGAHAHLERNA